MVDWETHFREAWATGTTWTRSRHTIPERESDFSGFRPSTSNTIRSTNTSKAVDIFIFDFSSKLFKEFFPIRLHIVKKDDFVHYDGLRFKIFCVFFHTLRGAQHVVNNSKGRNSLFEEIFLRGPVFLHHISLSRPPVCFYVIF